MPVYEYSALDRRGKTISGIVDADGAMAARQKLRASGIFPIRVDEARGDHRRGRKADSALSRHLARVKPADIALMTRQLATLLSAGFPLVTALDSLIPQSKSHGLRRLLAGLKGSVVEGNSFAGALALYPATFSELYMNMVRAGESSGTLEIVLERLAEITEKQQSLKNRIRSALAYPVLMTVVGTGVLFFLLTSVVPSIITIFEDMHQVLPAPTRILIGISGFFENFWLLMIGAAVGAGVVLQRFRKTRYGRYRLDRLKLSLPFFGQLNVKLAVSRFARTLGSLLENGVTMLAALEIVRNIVGNQVLTAALADVSKDVSRGKGLGNALSDAACFPELAVQMVHVGENSGSLETMLYKVADIYEGEVESTIMSLTALLEPVMILIMFVIIGFIVISIILPIFEMNQLVG